MQLSQERRIEINEIHYNGKYLNLHQSSSSCKTSEAQ